MMKLIAPCKDCKDRVVGCHSVCEKYITYRILKDKENEDREKQAALERDLNIIEKNRKRKRIPRKKRQ